MKLGQNIRHADKRVALLRNPKYFSCDFSARDNYRIPTNIQLKKNIILRTNRNIGRAPHPFKLIIE